jgi:hypothetical protein
MDSERPSELREARAKYYTLWEAVEAFRKGKGSSLYFSLFRSYAEPTLRRVA